MAVDAHALPCLAPTDWLRAAAQRKDRLRNPAGHWIDFCKRRARGKKKEG